MVWACIKVKTWEYVTQSFGKITGEAVPCDSAVHLLNDFVEETQ